MSAQSPWLQFVTRLPDLPKSEAKGVILVRGPWDESPGSPDLPFDVNHSMVFPSVYRQRGLPTDAFAICPLCTRVSLLWVVCARRSRRGKLVHWVERVSFEKIQRLLEISEQERNHEVLLTMKNLNDLSHHPSPYNVSIISCPLPSEIVEGEHFTTADLLNLIPGSSSPTGEAESEATGRELVLSTQLVHPFFTSEDSDPAP